MDKLFAPDITVQRQMLELKRDQYKAQGYDHFLEAEAAKVQDPGPDSARRKEFQQAIAALEKQSANAYTAARKLQELLDQLPKEEATSDGD